MLDVSVSLCCTLFFLGLNILFFMLRQSFACALVRLGKGEALTCSYSWRCMQVARLLTAVIWSTCMVVGAFERLKAVVVF